MASLPCLLCWFRRRSETFFTHVWIIQHSQFCLQNLFLSPLLTSIMVWREFITEWISSSLFCQLFVYSFLAKQDLVFRWAPRSKNLRETIQHVMLEQHLCHFQTILCTFNETINVVHSTTFEPIYSPACFMIIRPLMIPNTEPLITITSLPLGKNDALLKIIRMTSFWVDGDERIQTFWILKLGGMRLSNEIYRRSVSLDYAKYRPSRCYLLSEMRLHRMSGHAKKRQSAKIHRYS